MEFPGHEITFSLTSELHLQLLRKLCIVISLSHFDSVGNYKLQSPIGSSDVRLSWDPMIYGDSWMEYLRFGPSKIKNPAFMITVLNKGRILNSHKWFSAHRYLLWSHSSLSEYFSSPHFLYYMLTTWTQLYHSAEILWLPMYTATQCGPPPSTQRLQNYCGIVLKLLECYIETFLVLLPC